MGNRSWLGSFAVLTTLALVPRPAHAMEGVICDLVKYGSIAAGTVYMLVDAGFTINAIAQGGQSPGYPDAATAGWQVGLMVPQIVLSGIGVLSNTQTCSSSSGTVAQAIPLAWSVGLLGHGIWALSEPRLTVLPTAPGKGALGLRLQGRF